MNNVKFSRLRLSATWLLGAQASLPASVRRARSEVSITRPLNRRCIRANWRSCTQGCVRSQLHADTISYKNAKREDETRSLSSLFAFYIFNFAFLLWSAQ